ncbi:MAG: ATP-binding cassette domain-containing protein [Candidatus Aenigmatarchaeota archaeon]
MNAIETNSLTKKFDELAAVDSVNLEIMEGEMFGLLGPNGAGKTTTISMLATMLEPTSGSAKINGFDIRNKDNVRKSIGIVFQDPSLDDELTGKENLEFHARMYHMQKNLREKRTEEVLKLVELEDKANQRVKTYSGGMKRRLEIARGLMHHPKILFLDEPTLGLDPQTRRSIWEHIRRLNKQEKITIILTTHYMEEAEYLCNRIAIIDHGKIIALDTPDNLKNIMGGDILTLETDNAEELKKILKFEWIKEIKIFDSSMNIIVNNGEKVIPKILEIAGKNRIRIISVKLKKPTLEDVFIHYTGRAIREEEGSSLDKMRMRFRRG